STLELEPLAGDDRDLALERRGVRTIDVRNIGDHSLAHVRQQPTTDAATRRLAGPRDRQREAGLEQQQRAASLGQVRAHDHAALVQRKAQLIELELTDA